jgi:hypothetical protein
VRSLEDVQLTFLRLAAGGMIPKTADSAALLREFGCKPLQVHWAIIIGKYWDKLSKMDEGRPARRAFIESIRQALRGHQGAWAYKVLKAFQNIGAVPQEILSKKDTPEGIQDVLQCGINGEMAGLFESHFLNLRWDGLEKDPCTAPSEGIMRCTYESWVADPEAHRRTAAPHVSQWLPAELRRTLVLLRLGVHQALGIHSGRYANKPRHERICRGCSMGAVDDLKHFLTECPALVGTRLDHKALFCKENGEGKSTNEIFKAPDQRYLASVLHTMIQKHAITNSNLPGAARGA